MKVSLAAERDPVAVGIGDGGGAGIVKRDFVRKRAIFLMTTVDGGGILELISLIIYN